MKPYGRAPTFLAMTGRGVRRRRLFNAPETDHSGCCAPVPQFLQLGPPAAVAVGAAVGVAPAGGCCGS